MQLVPGVWRSLVASGSEITTLVELIDRFDGIEPLLATAAPAPVLLLAWVARLGVATDRHRP